MVTHAAQKAATAKRWIEFAVTSGMIVSTTVGSVWALMVYALDKEYVQLEEFEEFKASITKQLDKAVAEISCGAQRQQVKELNTVIAFKQSAGQDAALEKLLRENYLEDLQGNPECMSSK